MTLSKDRDPQIGDWIEVLPVIDHWKGRQGKIVRFYPTIFWYAVDLYDNQFPYKINLLKEEFKLLVYQMEIFN